MIERMMKGKDQEGRSPPPHNHKPRPESFSTNPGEFILTWTILLVLAPVLIPLLISIIAYRATIRQLATHLAHLKSPLTPYDCIFAVDSYHTRPYASNLTVLELAGRLDLNTLRRTFKEKILENGRFEKLKFVPVEFMGYWFWKDLGRRMELVLESCIKIYHDSELVEGKKSVDECLREIVEMPYEKELFNVCLLHFGNKSLVVFRIHHTVCDGYSFNHLIDTFVGLESKYLVREKKEEELKKNLIERSIEMAWEFKRLVYLFLHLPLHVSTLYRESLNHTPNYYTLPKSSTSGTIRRTVLPLSQVKRVRQATGSHFASIGMSLMTGALQKLYDETGRPESLRPDRLAIMHSLPKPNHPLRSLCNHWGVGLFKIPFCRNSIERMKGSEGDFNEYLRLQFDRVIHIHIPFVGLIPCWVIKWFFSINFGTSCGFTSVPGLFDRIAYVGGGKPGEPGAIDPWDGGVLEKGQPPAPGVEVKHMWKVFGLQWRQSAVAVAMYTYRGEASVSIYANKDIVPDESSMDRLLELFHEEFNELLTHSNNSPNNISNNKINNPTTTPPSSLPPPLTTATMLKSQQQGEGNEDDAMIIKNNKPSTPLPHLLQQLPAAVSATTTPQPNGVLLTNHLNNGSSPPSSPPPAYINNFEHQQQFPPVLGTGKFFDASPFMRNNKLA